MSTSLRKNSLVNEAAERIRGMIERERWTAGSRLATEAELIAELGVSRYVERNALRANMVSAAEQWRWCSLWHRTNKPGLVSLAEWPLACGQRWLDYVNQVETEAELKALRRSAWSGTPFGDTVWQQRTAKRLGLESSLRSPGRPKSRKPP